MAEEQAVETSQAPAEPPPEVEGLRAQVAQLEAERATYETEVAVPGELFAAILERVTRLRLASG